MTPSRFRDGLSSPASHGTSLLNFNLNARSDNHHELRNYRLRQDPAVHGGRRVVFLASDDDGAAAEIAALAENLGFSPIKLGGLSEGGLLVQARGNSWGQLIFKDLVKFD